VRRKKYEISICPGDWASKEVGFLLREAGFDVKKVQYGEYSAYARHEIV
jgi:hypothetical protein